MITKQYHGAEEEPESKEQDSSYLDLKLLIIRLAVLSTYGKTVTYCYIRFRISDSLDHLLTALRKCDCIPFLLSFIKEEQPAEMQEAAAFALSNIVKPCKFMSIISASLTCILDRNRRRLVSDGVILQLQECIDNTLLDSEARKHCQAAMNCLHSYFWHTYLSLSQHTPVLSARNVRKRSDAMVPIEVNQSPQCKRANVKVEYSEEARMLNPDGDGLMKLTKLDTCPTSGV